MANTVNRAAAGYARSLIGAGKVNNSAAFSFSEEDGKSLLGDPANWMNYGRHHLGVDESAPEDTAARHTYPIAKGGTLYRSALMSAAARAGQQGDDAVAKAAKSLIEGIDAMTRSSPRAKEIGRFEVKLLQETGRFEGYGSTFGGTPDSYGDLIAPGAFKDTLREHQQQGTYPLMLFSHDTHRPCGEWLNMTEDNKGLYVEGQLWVDGAHPNADANTVHRCMQMQRTKMGLSIGFSTKAFSYDAETKLRTLTEIQLFEVSPTLFPANPMAVVLGVKEFTPRNVEAHLREEFGLTREEAKIAASVAFRTIRQTRDEDGMDKRANELLAELSTLQQLIRKFASSK